MDNSKILELREAIKNNDLDRLSELVDKNMEWNDELAKLLLHLAVENNNLYAIKLLIQHRDSVDRDEINCIFKLNNNEYLKELLFHIINHYKDVKIMQMIFQELIARKYEDPSSVEILELLIEHGLDVNGYIGGLNLTPLHIAVKNKRTDLVS